MKYNAKAEFEKNEKDNEILMKMLKEMLAERSTKYRKEGLHGGHVGTLMHVRSKLKELYASMTLTPNCEEEKINAEIEKKIASLR